MTIISTMVAGSWYSLPLSFPDYGALIRYYLVHPLVILHGWPYALAIILVLLGHELGHYLACRHYRLAATLPYFIPAPTLVGTFGAFIRIKEPVPNRRVLFDMAFAGPATSFVLSLPVLMIGLSLSSLSLPDPDNIGIFLGRSLIMGLMERIYFPSAPGNYVILWHPLVMAGWFGLLATAINLLPIGQLDGGHIFYAVFQKHAGKMSIITFLFLVIMGVIFFYPGWILFAAILLIIGLRHPKPLLTGEPLSPGRKWLAFCALLIFIFSFMPRPVHFW